nr:cobalt-precorrin-4/precorrin-4 C(11)-methyltransferase [Kibdelosporangium sp. MJ126-NF4]CEL16743.1 Cobalt-precorrin-4 C11-methyltransferase [Kibdelosporangium sp. MJ126-NF4]CTQ92028.1 Cobalt-precorrin-4 C11-methyltransferase (EC 2.1.1.133) [Kibdelosporangium sp. MJ126-NF4]
MSAGISFVGAGPGATDLITVRGARRIGEADVVVWTPSIIDAGWVRENAKPEAELIDLARHTDDEIVEVYRRAVRDKLRVARLFPGDPATWSGLRAQLDVCARVGLPADVVAGVSPMSAAAVSVGVSLTEPDFADSVIMAGQETTGMPDLTQIKEFAQFGTTMAVLVPAARAAELADALRAGGYDDTTPVLAAYKVSWPDEIVVRTTIGELVATVKQHRLWRHTLFVVGGAVRAGKTRPAAGETPRRPESVARWSRTRSRSSWRADANRSVTATAQEKPAEEPEQSEKPQRVTAVVPQPAKKPVPQPKAAAAASTATKSVTAQAKKPAATPAAAAKAAAKQPVKNTAKTTAKAATPKPAGTRTAGSKTTGTKTTGKKTTRTQPQRPRRTG